MTRTVKTWIAVSAIALAILIGGIAGCFSSSELSDAPIFKMIGEGNSDQPSRSGSGSGYRINPF